MIVFVKKTGGQLGNRLFTFSHIYSFCLEHGFSLVHIDFEDYAGHFENMRVGRFIRLPLRSNRVVAGGVRAGFVKMLRLGMSAVMKFPFRKSFVASLKVGGEGNAFRLDDTKFVESLRGKKILRLEGFVLRADSFFEKYAKEIRTLMVPTVVIREKVQQTVCEARKDADLLIGVHIRRGDYKGFQGGRFFFEIEQYAGLMRKVSGLFSNKRIRFLVCSNETLQATQFSDLAVSFGPGHLVEDMYSLAACDYLLGTHSTFVMWASFYGQVPLYRFDDPARKPDLSEFRTDWS